jgi:acetylornithine deacetylase
VPDTNTMRKNAQLPADILAQLVSFDTVSRHSNLALIDYIAAYLGDLGIHCDVIYNINNDKANLFATLGGPPDVPGIVLSGHTDVVPVDGQDWSSDPFTMEERDGKLFGRGTADMKGFIATCLALAPEIARAPLREPIHVAFSYDEEVGCRGVAAMIEKVQSREPLPRICIIGEPTEMKVVNAHKGICACRTTVKGRESHSSNTEFGESAIFAAARLVEHLRQLAGDLKENADQSNPFEPPYTSINVGTLNGGSALNIVPNHCSFEWEYRPLPDDDIDHVLNSVTRFSQDVVLPEMQANYPEASITTELIARAPALMREENSSAEELVLALTGQNEANVVAYATEAGIFQEAGMSSVVCGPGCIDQAHRPDEFLAVSQLDEAEAFIRKLVAALSS